MSEIAEYDNLFSLPAAGGEGRQRVVGVNVHTDTVTGDLDILRVSHEVET